MTFSSSAPAIHQTRWVFPAPWNPCIRGLKANWSAKSTSSNSFTRNTKRQAQHLGWSATGGLRWYRGLTRWETPLLQQTPARNRTRVQTTAGRAGNGAAATPTKSSLIGWEVRGAGFEVRVGRMGVSLGFGSRWSGSPALGVENAGKGFLELAAEARVDDGVNAAVEVAQPEGYLKNGVRRLAGWEDRAWKIPTNTSKNQGKKRQELAPATAVKWFRGKTSEKCALRSPNGDIIQQMLLLGVKNWRFCSLRFINLKIPFSTKVKDAPDIKKDPLRSFTHDCPCLQCSARQGLTPRAPFKPNSF